MRIIFSFMVLALCCVGCHNSGAITQVNTIDSLLAGVYDGELSLAEARQYGNFGIGTFDRLDGEMLLLDGVFYQIKADGKVYVPPDDMTTPFASLCWFEAQSGRGLANLSFDEFCAALDELAPNIPLAVMLSGEFAFMHTRSVPAQNKPYPPLVEASKNQAEFKMQSIRGVIVGFRLPAYFKGINVPGYHLHFISQNRQQGGHVLGFSLRSGQAWVNQFHEFYMLLPAATSDFAGADLSRDRSQELQAVESAR